MNFINALNDLGAAVQPRLPYIPTIRGATGVPEIEIDGKTYVQFCTSNYLGLATDERVRAAAHQALDECGVGTNGSRLVSGTGQVHIELEARLAGFKQTPASTLFSSGTLANMGFLQAVVGFPLRATIPEAIPCGRVDLFYDGLVHQSLLDGLALAGASSARHFRHNDMTHLTRLLERSKAEFRLVVVDGVYSADGDTAPLDVIDRLCHEYDATVLVDDAHGTGMLGASGRGACELFGIDTHDNVVEMGTLSKSFGASGGYIASTAEICDYLRVGATPYVFTAALPASIAAAAAAAIDIAAREPWRRETALANAEYVRDGARRMGLDTGESTTQIVPIIIGDEAKTRAVSARLMDAGVYSPSVEFPAAPLGKARIRASNTALHDRGHLDLLLNALEGATRAGCTSRA